jgi:hypothetical protein
MRGDQSGHPRLPHQPHQRVEHRIGRGRVQVAGRLIGQKQLRSVRHRPAERHPLLFAPGQFRRPVTGPRRHPDRGQQCRRPVRRRTRADAMGQLRQDHVLGGRELGQQMVELVDEPNRTTPRRSPGPVARAGHVMARDLDRAAIGRVQKPGDMQQRRFPRPRGRDQGHNLAPGHGQVGPRQHLHLIGPTGIVPLLKPRQPQHRLTHSAAPRPGSYAPRGAQEGW